MEYDPYTALANVTIEQAVDDYRRSKHYQEITAIKNFFLSEWFSVLTDLDGKPPYAERHVRWCERMINFALLDCKICKIILFFIKNIKR